MDLKLRIAGGLFAGLLLTGVATACSSDSDTKETTETTKAGATETTKAGATATTAAATTTTAKK